MSRLTFPTVFAKEQNTYFIKDRMRMYLFDHTSQYIIQLSFGLGEITSTGLDKYVYEKYSAREKLQVFSNEEIVFSRRTYTDSNGDTVNQVGTDGYTFLNDQLLYDAQLGYDAFNINKDLITVSAGGTYSTYPEQLAASKYIMRDKEWITKFAQKHFLLIFKANNLNQTPKVLYGFRMRDLRDHPYDKFKY